MHVSIYQATESKQTRLQRRSSKTISRNLLILTFRSCQSSMKVALPLKWSWQTEQTMVNTSKNILSTGWPRSRPILRKKSLEKSGRVCPLLFFAVIVQTLQSIGFTNRKINPSEVKYKKKTTMLWLVSTCWLISQNSKTHHCSVQTLPLKSEFHSIIIQVFLP